MTFRRLKTIRLWAESFSPWFGLTIEDHISKTVEHLNLEEYQLSQGLLSRLGEWYVQHEPNCSLSREEVEARESELQELDRQGIELLKQVAEEIGSRLSCRFEYMSVPSDRSLWSLES